MFRMIRAFAADESGATAIEYALIASLVSVGIVGALDLLGGSVSTAMTSVSSDLAEVAARSP